MATQKRVHVIVSNDSVCAAEAQHHVREGLGVAKCCEWARKGACRLPPISACIAITHAIFTHREGAVWQGPGRRSLARARAIGVACGVSRLLCVRRSLPKRDESGACTDAGRQTLLLAARGSSPAAGRDFGRQRSGRERDGVRRAACKTLLGEANFWSQQTDRQLLNGNGGAFIGGRDAGCMGQQQTGTA